MGALPGTCAAVVCMLKACRCCAALTFPTPCRARELECPATIHLHGGRYVLRRYNLEPHGRLAFRGCRWLGVPSWAQAGKA